MTTTDPIGTVLNGIAAGATTGAALMTGGVATIRYLQAGGEPDPDLAFGIVTGTALGGLAAAAVSGWMHARRLSDRWRQGVTAAVSAFGAVLLAIVATPVDLMAGRAGVLVYTAALIAAVVYFHSAATRASAR